MDWHLPPEVLKELEAAARVPVRFEDLPAAFRQVFEVFDSGPPEWILRHEDGAFLIGRLLDGVVQQWTVVEGEAAQHLDDRLEFRVSASARAVSQELLVPGAPVDAALQTLFADRGHELARCERADGGERRTWQALPGMAVLELLTGPEGALAKATWLEEELAAAEVEAVRQRMLTLEVARPVGPLRARTVTEAFCHVRFRGLEVDLAKRVPQSRRLEIWGRIAKKPRQFVYSIDTWVGGCTAGPLGEGTSHLMDPVCWALWANRLLEQAGEAVNPVRAALDLVLAADALEQAERFIPDGDELPPEGIYATEASAAVREETPEFVSRGRLVAMAATLRKAAAALA